MKKINSFHVFLVKFFRIIVVLFTGFFVLQYTYKGHGGQDIFPIIIMGTLLVSVMFNFIYQNIEINSNTKNLTFFKTEIIFPFFIFILPSKFPLFISIMEKNAKLFYTDFLPFTLIMFFINTLISGLAHFVLKIY